MRDRHEERKELKSPRFLARRKVEVVLRLLRGEDIEFLSRELCVPAAYISQWRDKFLSGGSEAVSKRPEAIHEREIARLREKLGEMTMDNELLLKKIHTMEEGRPLGVRRRKR
jgi:transposase